MGAGLAKQAKTLPDRQIKRALAEVANLNDPCPVRPAADMGQIVATT